MSPALHSASRATTNTYYAVVGDQNLSDGLSRCSLDKRWPVLSPQKSLNIRKTDRRTMLSATGVVKVSGLLPLAGEVLSQLLWFFPQNHEVVHRNIAKDPPRIGFFRLS